MISQNISIGEHDTQPLVSVIMNCYNSEKYLREAIDSVLAQTYQNWEVIFWDNQSTDRSVEIFKSYQDSRMKYFYAPEHTTLGQARNLAVEQAAGEWCAFLDCDDLWLPEKLEKQVVVANKYPDAVLVYGGTKIILHKEAEDTPWGKAISNFQSNNDVRELPEGQVFEKLLIRNFIPMVSAIVRRRAYWLVGGINPNLKQAEDLDLFVKLSCKFEVRVVRSIICGYRVHLSNLTHSQLDTNFNEVKQIISMYLPMPEAKCALLIHHVKHAAVLMRQGFYMKGLFYIARKGSFILFLNLAWNKLRKSV